MLVLRNLHSAVTWLILGHAITSTHASVHSRRAPILPPSHIHRRSNHLTEQDQSRLSELGFGGVGYNEFGSGPQAVWIGKDGSYTNTFYNKAGQNLILVVWGAAASWVNVHRPLVTLSMLPNSSITTSFATDTSGAWTAIYPDTPNVDLHNGQVFNTWGEFTWNVNGAVDVSRLVNMNGHPMAIHTATCVSDMERCVFVCPESVVTCMTGYELRNCMPGSQVGVQSGFDQGAPSGGCGGLDSQAHTNTFFM